jgi:hypothetical protein
VRNALYLRLKPKDKEMKKVFFLVGFSIPILLSMTFREANSYCGANPQIHFTIPVKPKSTIIIDKGDLSTYLKKGYQVQQMVLTSNNYGTIKLLMVKY